MVSRRLKENSTDNKRILTQYEISKIRNISEAISTEISLLLKNSHSPKRIEVRDYLKGDPSEDKIVLIARGEIIKKSTSYIKGEQDREKVRDILGNN